MRLWAAVLFIVLAHAVTGGSTAFAGGLEYAGAGTQGAARGGAVAAKAEDPMVLMYNPAGLVELRGTQLLLNANLALMKACVDPYGYYGWGTYGGGMASRLIDPKTGVPTELMLGRGAGPAEQAYYQGALDTVCMRQGITPVPQLGFTARLSNRFGIGLGMVFPNVTPQGQWGDDSGIISTPLGPRPAATRYMMINSGNIGIFPTLGLAYKIAEFLRIGVSVGFGVINVDNVSIAAVQVGTTPANDMLAHVRATDWFVPEATASVHIVPFDAVDIVGGFHWQDDLNAAGTIDLTSGVYDLAKKPRTKVNQVDAVQQKFPWKAWGALRFASRLAPRSSGDGNEELKFSHGHTRHDAFQDERWDLEADVQYEMNARHTDLILTPHPGQLAEFESTMGTITTLAYPDPSMPQTIIQKRWQDQLSLRFGGSYNILPGLFGVSAGFHYENRGVDPAYMQIDFWPVQRMGFHGGVRFRIASFMDLSFSYAHIIQETLDVAAPLHETFQTAGMRYMQTNTVTTIDKRVGAPGTPEFMTPREEVRPAAPDGEARLTQNFAKNLPGTPPFIINAGRYRSGIDVVSVGANMHF